MGTKVIQVETLEKWLIWYSKYGRPSLSLEIQVDTKRPGCCKKRYAERMVKVLLDGFNWVHKNDEECMNGVAGGEIKQWTAVDHGHYETIVAARKAKIEAKK